MNRLLIYDKCNGHCAYCGEEITMKQLQVDHIIPTANFDSFVMNNRKIPEFLSHLTIKDVNHPDNLFPACAVCNRHKRTFDLEGFRIELSMQVERANKRSFNYRMAKKYNQVVEQENNIIFYFEQKKYRHVSRT